MDVVSSCQNCGHLLQQQQKTNTEAPNLNTFYLKNLLIEAFGQKQNVELNAYFQVVCPEHGAKVLKMFLRNSKENNVLNELKAPDPQLP